MFSIKEYLLFMLVCFFTFTIFGISTHYLADLFDAQRTNYDSYSVCTCIITDVSLEQVYYRKSYVFSFKPVDSKLPVKKIKKDKNALNYYENGSLKNCWYKNYDKSDFQWDNPYPYPYMELGGIVFGIFLAFLLFLDMFYYNYKCINSKTKKIQYNKLIDN
jgi:hypothetical protein